MVTSNFFNTEQKDKILNLINKDELVQLTLALGNIYSPYGKEKEIGDFLFNWLKENGFETKKMGMLDDRFNVIGVYRGSGGGFSLIFNSHMDTAYSRDDKHLLLNPEDRIYHEAWLKGDKIQGQGVVNDKGPMAAFMIATKAIKQSGLELKGDIILTMVPGEIGQEPVDEFQGPKYLSKETGARYMVTHGVVADYALVAEATAFAYTGVEAGKAFFKITVFGDHPVYTPYLRRPTTIEQSPNAIVRTSKVIQKIEEWAYEYEKNNKYEFPGGILIPKVNIGAIRGGVPWKIISSQQFCSIYIDVRLPPGKNPLEIKEDLKRLVSDLKIPIEVELFLYRRGYEAKNASRLIESIEKAHNQIFNEAPKPVDSPTTSMWRDTNVFNEVGIPSVTYGPGMGVGGGRYFLSVDEMVTCSKLYALIALNLCDQARDQKT
jgi:acetylornithine deacetylase/succinyl-diaminopimelate desuccinylase-like protein